MSKIETLVRDIERTLLGLNGWQNALGDRLGQTISKTASQRFSKPQKRRSYISFSSMGTPCKRKVWYKINEPILDQSHSPSLLLKFFYGDIIEELMLTLAVQSGHEVVGMQDRMHIGDMVGHRDAVIDGMTVDVKSASSFAFKKFQENKLREEDSFGYISQLSSYVYAAKDDPLVTEKTKGAFLVVDKVNGSICLDVYDFTKEIKEKEEEIRRVKEIIEGDIPERGYEPVPQISGSPNKKLAMPCVFCDYKKRCFPELRKFVYKDKNLYLTEVAKKPNVPEDLTF